MRTGRFVARDNVIRCASSRSARTVFSPDRFPSLARNRNLSATRSNRSSRIFLGKRNFPQVNGKYVIRNLARAYCLCDAISRMQDMGCGSKVSAFRQITRRGNARISRGCSRKFTRRVRKLGDSSRANISALGRTNTRLSRRRGSNGSWDTAITDENFSSRDNTPSLVIAFNDWPRRHISDSRGRKPSMRRAKSKLFQFSTTSYL